MFDLKFDDFIFNKYSYCSSFSEGLASVQNEKGLCGYIDKYGMEVVPCKYKYAYSFSNGLACVQDEKGLYGYISKTGIEVIPCKYKYAYSFSNGLACVQDENGLYGYIDKFGTQIISHVYRYADPFSCDVARVNLNNCIDKNGNKIKLNKNYSSISMFNDGLSLVQDGNGFSKYINTKGKVVLNLNKNADYNFCTNFSEGLAYVKRDNLYGYIDKTGKLVIPFKYSFVSSFSNGLASVKNKDGLYGYIDKTGNEIIPCKYKNAYLFNKNLACVRNQDGLYGYIDKTGNEIIPCKYKNAVSFSEGLALVTDEIGKMYYINELGNTKISIPSKYCSNLIFDKNTINLKANTKIELDNEKIKALKYVRDYLINMVTASIDDLALEVYDEKGKHLEKI